MLRARIDALRQCAAGLLVPAVVHLCCRSVLSSEHATLAAFATLSILAAAIVATCEIGASTMGTIKGIYFPEIILLCELQLQCKLANQALKILKIGFEDWHNPEKKQPISFSAPLEQVRSAHSFLSHANSIGKMISLKGRRRHQSVKKRVTHLQSLLEITDEDIPNLSSLKLRDDWEHIDERLDSEFQKWDGSRISIEEIRVLPQKDILRLPKSSRENILILRRIDPDTPSIHFLSRETKITVIASEIAFVDQSVEKAWPKLSAEAIPPLHPKK